MAYANRKGYAKQGRRLIGRCQQRVLARFVRHDSGEENRRLLKTYLEQNGRPVAFYTDRASLFVNTPKNSAGENPIPFRDKPTFGALSRSNERNYVLMQLAGYVRIRPHCAGSAKQPSAGGEIFGVGTKCGLSKMRRQLLYFQRFQGNRLNWPCSCQ